MTIIAFFFAVAAIAVAASKKGELPESVSEIAYIIPKWAFSLWIVAVGALLMVTAFGRLGTWQFLGFLMMVGLLGIAVTPYYKKENKALHYGGGLLSGIVATAIVAVLQPILLCLWSWYVPYLFLSDRRKSLFFLELTVFVLLIISLLI